MGSFASAVVRLVGPFHCSWLAAKKTFIRVCIQTDSICCRSGGLLFRLDFFWMDYCFDRPRTRNRTIPRAFEQALDCARGARNVAVECAALKISDAVLMEQGLAQPGEMD